MTNNEAIATAEEAMGIKAYCVHVAEPEEGERHQHIALAWRGGVIWLDMSDQGDHFCIDVRQFVPSEGNGIGAELAGQGVFTIVNGRRQALGGPFADNEALEDPDGTPVRGHGWNAGYVVTLMHDKVPSDDQTNRPPGSGRG